MQLSTIYIIYYLYLNVIEQFFLILLAQGVSFVYFIHIFSLFMLDVCCFISSTKIFFLFVTSPLTLLFHMALLNFLNFLGLFFLDMHVLYTLFVILYVPNPTYDIRDRTILTNSICSLIGFSFKFSLKISFLILPLVLLSISF